MTNRRQFLRNASLLAAAGVCANELSAASVSATSGFQPRKSFGLQTYSLGRELAPDVPEGLKKVAQMGYTSIEMAGYNAEGRIGAVPMAEFKKYADDAGLKIVSTHVNPPMPGYTKENFEKATEFWKKAADHHAEIGCKYLIQPGQPLTRSTEEVAYTGEAFNEFGKIAKAAGLIFGFHNHSGEFARVVPGGTEALPVRLGGDSFFFRQPEGAKMIYDGMIEATDPSLVVFELDVYWCVMGMQDPVAYMKKYADRIRVLHIKDVNILGESGMMNFQKIFETAYGNGVTEYIVEFEPSFRGGTLFEGVKACADYLLNASFVK